VAYDAEYFAAEGNRLLPDLEIPKASCHGQTMAELPDGGGIKTMPPGAKACGKRSRPSASCGNPRL
jgi:hypothetical protein